MFQDVAQSKEQHVRKGGVFDKYDIQKVLGSGAFATVKLAVANETGRRCAVKIIEKRKVLLQPALALAFKREVEILKTLDHVRRAGY